MLTPTPVFLNLGIPTPAKSPPNCGAAGAAGAPELPPSDAAVSLLMRLGVVAAARDGAVGNLPRPGIAGADAMDGPDEDVGLSSIGADLSLVSVFLSLVPFVMSPSNAP